MEDGQNIEFFLEGTRSRTGKSLTPKTGMLSALVEPWLASHPKLLAERSSEAGEGEGEREDDDDDVTFVCEIVFVCNFSAIFTINYY